MIDTGTLNVSPPSVENAKKIGDCTYAPLLGLKMKRVQLTYTRSRKGLRGLESAAIHSLSLKMAGDVVGLMNVGGPQVRLPLPSNVPLFTVTVFGGAARSNPRPA